MSIGTTRRSRTSSTRWYPYFLFFGSSQICHWFLAQALLKLMEFSSPELDFLELHAPPLGNMNDPISCTGWQFSPLWPPQSHSCISKSCLFIRLSWPDFFYIYSSLSRLNKKIPSMLQQFKIKTTKSPVIQLLLQLQIVV